MKKILGFTGPISAGKGTAAEIAANRLGAVLYSLGDEAREETTRRGLVLTRENIRATAQVTQARYGKSVWAERIIKKIKANEKEKSFFVVEGFRAIAEVDEFRKVFGKNFVLIAVTAPFEVRFERAKARAREDEPVTREGFKLLDDAERGVGGKGYRFEFDECVKRADYLIENTGSFEDLSKKTSGVIEKIL